MRLVVIVVTAANTQKPTAQFLLLLPVLHLHRPCFALARPVGRNEFVVEANVLFELILADRFLQVIQNALPV